MRDCGSRGNRTYGQIMNGDSNGVVMTRQWSIEGAFEILRFN